MYPIAVKKNVFNNNAAKINENKIIYQMLILNYRCRALPVKQVNYNYYYSILHRRRLPEILRIKSLIIKSNRCRNFAKKNQIIINFSSPPFA